jgi:hypothetical protein
MERKKHGFGFHALAIRKRIDVSGAPFFQVQSERASPGPVCSNAGAHDDRLHADALPDIKAPMTFLRRKKPAMVFDSVVAMFGSSELRTFPADVTIGTIGHNNGGIAIGG